MADKATVPIYYESRIAKLALNQAALPKIDEEFDEITEGEEEDKKQKLKTKWAALEALVGDPKRVALNLQFVATRNVRVRLPALGQKPHKIRSRSIHPSLAASLWSRVSENVTIAIFRDKTDTKSLKSRSGFAVCP